VQKGRQFFIIPAIITALVLIFVYVFYTVQKNSTKFPYPSSFVPEESILTYQGNYSSKSLTNFLQNTLTSKLLSLNNQSVNLDYYDSIFKSSDTYRKFSLNKEVIFCLIPTGLHKADILILQQTENKFSESDIQTALKEFDSKADFKKRNYLGKDIVDAYLYSSGKQFTFALKNGVLILSSNALLVEKSIKNEDKSKDQEISTLIESNKKNEVVILNYSKINTFLNNKIDLFPKLGFGVFKIGSNPKDVELSGNYHQIDTKINPILNDNQGNLNLNLSEYIPDNIYGLELNAIPNYKQFLSDDGLIKKKQENVDDSNQLTGQFTYNFSGKMAKFRLKNNFDDSTSQILLYNFKPTSEALSIFLKQAFIDSNIKFYYSKVNSSKIYHFDGSYLSKISHDFNTNTPYLAYFRGSNAYFTSSDSTIIELITDLKNKNTLNNNPYFIHLKNKVDFNAAQIKLAFNYQLTSCKQADDSLNLEPIQSYFSGIYIKKGSINQQIKLLNSEQNISQTQLFKEPKVEWETNLDDAIYDYTQIIKTKDGNKIITSDENNFIYCLSTEGAKEWKTQLDGKPHGVIKDIDLYKNGDKQFLLSSKNSLYLFNKSGKEIGNYPIHLGSRATSDITLLETDNKSASYFIGTQNNRIYGFELNGKPVPGWNPKIIDAPIVIPIKVINYQDNPVLIGLTDRGTMYFWNPEGHEIIKKVEFKKKFNANFIFNLGDNLQESSFIGIDNEGRVVKCNIKSGKFKELEMEGFKRFTNLTTLDIDQDGKKEIIFSCAQGLIVTNLSGKIIKKLKIPLLKIKNNISILKFGQKYYYAVIDGNNGWVKLYNTKGSLLKKIKSENTKTFLNSNQEQMLILTQHKKVKSIKFGL